MVLSRTQILAGFVVGTMLSTSVAQAQVISEAPIAEEGQSLVLSANGHALKMPLPDWLSADQLSAGNVWPLVDSTYRSDDSQALLEIYPKGESEALWKTLYGARITYTDARTLTAYRNVVMAGYAQTCKPELTGFFQLGADQGDRLAPLGFACGAYLDRLTGFAGMGEIMVMSFTKTENGVAIVYQEWRGPAFNPSDAASWPVPTSVVQARATQLQADATVTVAN
ncbi:hypothetical protein [Devosia sp. 2618]|uniref:hypothetical protein n=1 Tax=Devosia sp. 2618 TaxID=3156454 RepID=UPI00339634AC